MNAPETPRPLYLRRGASEGASDEPVFAVLHRGARPRRHTAVLMCPPFGWEDMCCYRIRRDWAERLARAGHTALRIDLPGSGDSAGAPTDPGRLDAWTRAVDSAARWLRHAEGAERVAAIGIGLGGLVACRAALTGAPIDELVLWSAPAQGRALLRELRAFSAFEVANNPDEGLVPEGEPLDDGTLAINGYLLSAETIAELQRLDLADLAQVVRPPAPEARISPTRGEPSTREAHAAKPSSAMRMRRALVLGRDGMKVKRALPDLLTAAEFEVQVADGQGYGAMMVEPQDARTPSEVIERVGAWLDAGPPPSAVATRSADHDTATPVTSSNPADHRTPPPAAPDGPADRDPQPTGHDEMVIDQDGEALRERPVFIEGPGGPLFGVLTEPLGEHNRELTAVLLNAGPQRRTGPNRMWVEIARRWAALGVPSLRLDAAGIGDSDGDATALARIAEFYRPAYAEQARAALDALAQRGLPPRFVMVGLCAGGYWAVQSALADERVAAVIMLNPRTLVFDEWRHMQRRTRLLRERALRTSTWGRVFRGEIQLARHLETGRTLLRRAAGAPTRAGARIATPGRREEAPPTEPAAVDPIEDLFDRLRDRGQRGLLLFTGKEILRGELAEKGVLERMDRWPNLELAIRGTSADTHTLTPVWLQRQVHQLLDKVLEDELKQPTEVMAAVDVDRRGV
jgi:alpha-beta hydrolase superfamily lysophospholipase